MRKFKHCFPRQRFCGKIPFAEGLQKKQKLELKDTGRNKLHEEVISLSLTVSDLTWLPRGSCSASAGCSGGGGGCRAPGLTIALASASVLPVALVAIVSAVCPLLGGGQQLPCLLLVLSDKRLSFFLLQLSVCHLIHIVAFFRQREVGYKSKKEACGPEKCIDE